MTAPAWMNAVIADFGRAAGADKLALGASGAATLRFANGASLRLEYTGDELVVAIVTAHTLFGAQPIRRLLALANPKVAGQMRMRAGIMPKTGTAVIAMRMPERDVTLPALNSTFSVLWRAMDEIGGVQ